MYSVRQYQCVLCENILDASIENAQVLAEMLPSVSVGRMTHCAV